MEIKAWYTSKYPNDDLGRELISGVTFTNLFTALDTYKDIYEVLGVGDSIIRERVFSKLAEVMNVDYEYIYSQWLLA